MKFGFDIEDQRIKDGIPFNFYGSIGYLKSVAFGSGLGQGAYTALGNFLGRLRRCFPHPLRSSSPAPRRGR